MKGFTAGRLLGLQLLLLLLGTQMPGPWRDAIQHGLALQLPLSQIAHVLMFAGLAATLALPPRAWPLGRIVLAALLLALGTEALQLLAIERHTRFADVLLDLAGAFAGAGIVKWGWPCIAPR